MLHIAFDAKHTIVDPFISGNSLASHISINALRADYILAAHGLQDHLLDVGAITKNNPDAIQSPAMKSYNGPQKRILRGTL